MKRAIINKKTLPPASPPLLFLGWVDYFFYPRWLSQAHSAIGFLKVNYNFDRFCCFINNGKNAKTFIHIRREDINFHVSAFVYEINDFIGVAHVGRH